MSETVNIFNGRVLVVALDGWTDAGSGATGAANYIREKLGAERLQEELDKEIELGTVDRVVLDMLAPWECVKSVSAALAPGGVLICYVATVTQLSRVAEEIRTSGEFTEPQERYLPW